MADYYWEI